MRSFVFLLLVFVLFPVVASAQCDNGYCSTERVIWRPVAKAVVERVTHTTSNQCGQPVRNVGRCAKRKVIKFYIRRRFKR